MPDYRDLFNSEAKEILQALNTLLIDLEKNTASVELLNEIFRQAHTLKGMAAAMEYTPIVQLSHGMEHVLDALRKDFSKVNQNTCSVLFEVFDVLNRLVTAVESKGSASDIKELDDVIKKLNAIAASAPAPKPESFLEKRMLRLDDAQRSMIAKAAREGVRTYIVKIVLSKDCSMVEARSFVVLQTLKDAGDIINESYVHNQIESARFGRSFVLFFMTKGNIDQIRANVKAIAEVDLADFRLMLPEALPPAAEAAPAMPEEKNIRASAPAQTIRVPVKQLDHIVNLVGELVINRIQLETIAKSVTSMELTERLLSLNRLLVDLQTEALNVRLIPLTAVYDQFPRLVRDLAKSQGKSINLEIQGADIGLDRAILDEIKDPLIHILRNCVDHGIEIPDLRRKAGKSPDGLIKIQTRREGGMITIEVSDDGQGINIKRIKEKALGMGLITDEQARQMNDREAIMLITAAGLSTAEIITETSGRGVGMDMAKKKVELFGGSFAIDTRPSQGSTFIIKLPVSMLIMPALMVKIHGHTYAIAVTNVLKIISIDSSAIKTHDNRPVLADGDELIPLVCLAEQFGFGRSSCENGQIPVVIVHVNNKTAGLLVDELVSQQDMVIKDLDENLKKIKGISGATILGSGKVALIVDVPALV
jgi:two-component system chemotaxis sensor kinase CheA